MRSIKPYRLVWQMLLCVTSFIMLGLFVSAARQVAPELKVYKAVAPVYPPIARAAKAGGAVTVEVMVNKMGAVSLARSTAGHPLLRQAAEAAAKRWQFAPDEKALTNRKTTLFFNFTIMPDCSKYADMTPVFSPPYQVEVRTDPPEIICSDCFPQPDPCKNINRY